jgi:hypothetical protein
MKAKMLVSILLVTLVLMLTGNAIAGLDRDQEPAGTRAQQATLGTSFTYQGSLADSSGPISDTCDFEFELYTAASGGDQVGNMVTKSEVDVSDGVFAVQLDFGSDAFTGDARYLDISVRCPAGSGDYTHLTETGRQALTAVPYALHARSAWNLAGNSGVDPSTNFLGTTDNQPLVIKTNGTEAVRIDAQGRTGIGADAPTAKLTIDNVGGNTSFGNHAVYVASLNSYFDYHGGMIFRGQGADWAARFTGTDNMHPDGEIVGIYKEEISPGVSGDPIAVFKNDGNVGIGTITPTAKLMIDNVPTTTAQFGTNAIFIASPNEYFDYRAGLAFRGEGGNWATRFTSRNNMRPDGEIVGIYKEESYDGEVRHGMPPQGAVAVFKNNGNVGIGTITPTAKLMIDNVPTTTAQFGTNAIFIASPNEYFDYRAGLAFRGEGGNWATRFTSRNSMGPDGEILGIYKEESYDGEVRHTVPPQGAVAVFKNNGNVGIGTITPTAKLMIDNVPTTTAQFGTNALFIASPNEYFDYRAGLAFRGEGGNWATRFTSRNSMGPDGEILGIYKEESYDGEVRHTVPPQGAVAVFKNNGNVGIGTITPTAKLTIDEAVTNTATFGASAMYVKSVNSYFDYEGGMTFRGSGSAWATHFTGRDTMTDTGEIVGIYKEEISPGVTQGPIAVFNNDGTVGIGMTNPEHLIHLNGGAYSDGASWVDASSREYKTEITPLTLEQAQETLTGLDSVTFKYKADENGELHVGFIAEDVPELVATADRKGLSAMDIVGVLAKVVQDQQRQLTDQERQIADQQEHIDDLEARLTALEQAQGTARTPARPAISWELLLGLPIVGFVLEWRRRAGRAS